MSKFNNAQLKQLADFQSNLSLLFIAASFAIVFDSSQNVNFLLIFSGLALSAAFLILSLLTLKGNQT